LRSRKSIRIASKGCRIIKQTRMQINIKKLAVQTLNKIKYNVGSIPSNIKFKYELIKNNCNTCQDVN
jgi:hypothetical protein